MSKIPLTIDGEKSLKKVLADLKFIERPKISEAIAEARAHGDLKENAEYHAAKEEQGLIEARINYIEAQLQGCTVVDTAKINSTKVIFGATVTIENIETEEATTYQLVGEAETDMNAGKISYKSPVAQACIGQEVEDIVSVETPNGITEYEITAIEYR